MFDLFDSVHICFDFLDQSSICIDLFNRPCIDMFQFSRQKTWYFWTVSTLRPTKKIQNFLRKPEQHFSLYQDEAPKTIRRKPSLRKPIRWKTLKESQLNIASEKLWIISKQKTKKKTLKNPLFETSRYSSRGLQFMFDFFNRNCVCFDCARLMFRLCSTYALTLLDLCFDFLDLSFDFLD